MAKAKNRAGVAKLKRITKRAKSLYRSGKARTWASAMRQAAKMEG